MTAPTIRELLERTDLAELLTELSGPPTTVGHMARWRCCASDHDDQHPSVTMHRARDGVERWRCWSGDHGGTAIDALIAAHGITTSDAVHRLTERTTFTSPTARPAPTPAPALRVELSSAARRHLIGCAQLLWSRAGREALDWLHQRSLSDRVLHLNMVGYDPGERHLPRPDGLPKSAGVTYPSWDADGRLAYYQTRRLRTDDGPKYVNPNAAHGSAPPISYPLGGADDGPLVVTEGVADGLLATTAGVPNRRRHLRPPGAHPPGRHRGTVRRDCRRPRPAGRGATRSCSRWTTTRPDEQPPPSCAGPSATGPTAASCACRLARISPTPTTRTGANRGN